MSLRALALVDGEHYPAVVRDALAQLPYEFVGAVLVGGTEKLRGDDQDYGVPLAASVEAGIESHRPEIVVDLSDEPVLDLSNRGDIAAIESRLRGREVVL